MKYKLVFFNDKAIVIDMKATIPMHAKFYAWDKKEIALNRWASPDKLKEEFPHYHLIVATDAEMADLPGILPPKEVILNVWENDKIEQLAIKWVLENSDTLSANFICRRAFKAGYDANEGKFTKEQMKKCWEAARNWQIAETAEWHGGRENEKPDFNEVIKSLTIPHSLDVELEMEERYLLHIGGGDSLFITRKEYERHLHVCAARGQQSNVDVINSPKITDKYVIIKKVLV